MGNYITTTSIYQDRISRINTATVVAASVVASYIVNAEDIINGYAGQRYSLPFTDIPNLIKETTKDLTLYYLHRDFYTRDNQNFNDWLEQKKIDSFEILEGIAKGGIRLVHSNTVLSFNTSNLFKSTHTDIPLAINVDNSYNWGTSQKLLDKISDARELGD